MILKIADWDDAGKVHNALATETAMTRYQLSHSMKDSANCIITLADPGGALFRTYDADPANDSVYVGSGKIELNDPDADTLLKGRIKKVRHFEQSGKTVLVCADWTDQLKDRHRDWDCRADLDSDDDMSETGIRQSFAHGSLLDANTEYRKPVLTVGGNDRSYLIDSNRSWDADEFTLGFLAFAHENTGDVTIKLGPYNHLNGDTMTANGWAKLWVDDTNADVLEMTAAPLGVDFDFWVMVTEGTLFNSISSAKLHITAKGTDATIDGDISVYIDDQSDGHGGATALLGTIPADGQIYKKTFEIFADLLDGDLVNNDGEARVFILATDQAGQDPEVTIYFMQLELECNVDGITTVYDIKATLADPDNAGGTVNTISIDDDVGDDGADLEAMGVWEGCKYAIVFPIFHYIDTLIEDTTISCPLMTLTTTLESTSGLSTRNYQERTTMEIVQDLAEIDRALFWCPLGGVDVTWKSSFIAAGTALTDTDVIEWIETEWDSEAMINEVHIKGPRVNDEVLYTNTGDATYFGTDPAATSKDNFDYTRSKVVTSKGSGSQAEINDMAEAVVAASDNIQLFLRARLPGLDSTYRLGTEVKVTSTQMGLTNAMYVVTQWSYDSDRYETVIKMHPRANLSTKGMAEHLLSGGEYITHSAKQAQLAERDAETTSLHTQLWSN